MGRGSNKEREGLVASGAPPPPSDLHTRAYGGRGGGRGERRRRGQPGRSSTPPFPRNEHINLVYTHTLLHAGAHTCTHARALLQQSWKDAHGGQQDTHIIGGGRGSCPVCKPGGEVRWVTPAPLACHRPEGTPPGRARATHLKVWQTHRLRRQPEGVWWECDQDCRPTWGPQTPSLSCGIVLTERKGCTSGPVRPVKQRQALACLLRAATKSTSETTEGKERGRRHQAGTPAVTRTQHSGQPDAARCR